MFLWVKKDYAAQQSGDILISFDPPDSEEAAEWLEFTTRDRHYAEIAKELERAARDYDKSGDYRSRNISLNLARKLREMVDASPTVN
jgi:hypothetical protein